MIFLCVSILFEYAFQLPSSKEKIKRLLLKSPLVREAVTSPLTDAMPTFDVDTKCD